MFSLIKYHCNCISTHIGTYYLRLFVMINKILKLTYTAQTHSHSLVTIHIDLNFVILYKLIIGIGDNGYLTNMR